jgi:hypothetical protein
MSGFLIPPWYVEDVVDPQTMNIASIFWGFSMAFAIFSAVKAARQTYQHWRRKRRISAYAAMIWGHWLSNNLMAVINWFYLLGTIKARCVLSPYLDGDVFWLIDMTLSASGCGFSSVSRTLYVLLSTKTQLLTSRELCLQSSYGYSRHNSSFKSSSTAFPS